MKNLLKLAVLKKRMRVNPTPELTAFFQNRELLKFHIRSNRKSVENLLNFAIGFKQPKPSKYGTYIRTKENEVRMMATIKNLHAQNRKYKKQLREELRNVSA